MSVKENKFDGFYLSPLIVLGWGLFSFVFLPIIPVASGFGWDGVFYGKIALGFQNMLGSIDSYHANRIFPGVLIHYALRSLHSPFTLESVLLGYRIYNIVILTCSAVFWVLIVKRLKFGRFSKWLGFCALFVNYPLLNLHYYYPALTDGTAFLIGMIMLYAYLVKNQVLLLFVTMLAFFSWPAAVLAGFILFICSDAESAGAYNKQESTRFGWFLLLMAPSLAFIRLNFTNEIKLLVIKLGLGERLLTGNSLPSDYVHASLSHSLNAVLLALYLAASAWFLLKKLDQRKLAAFTFRREVLAKIFVLMLVLGLLVLMKSRVYSPALPTLTPFSYFTYYFTGANVRFPLQFVVGQITYWGPAIVLLMLFFREVAASLQKTALPFLLIFLCAVLFGINSEARPIISFYPFIVAILLQAVDFSALAAKKAFGVVFLCASLFYSKIWFPVTLPASVFPDSIWTGLDVFPMQGYFMNFALFSNARLYWVHAAAAAVFTGLLYITSRQAADMKDRPSAGTAPGSGR